MQLNKIPATIVTGFLGSGKTTLLSQVLKQAAGKRIAVIVNEFGELDIDANLLRSCPLECEEETANERDDGQGIYELANGCICCTVEEEFLPVMKELVKRRDQIDHLLIETSGLALPKPLVQAFNWPDIKQYFTVDSVVTVVDGPAVAAGRFAHDEARVAEQRLADDNLDHDPSLQELLDDQLAAADLVVISKKDLLESASLDRIDKLLAHKVPAAIKKVYVDHQQPNLEWLMGINAAAEDRIDQIHTHHDHHHDHGAHHEHAHDHFQSFVISLGEVDGAKLVSTLQMLISDFPIYRVKGFAAIQGKPMRQVVQAVGQRIDSHFDRMWLSNESRATQLVFIGKGIDQQSITASLAQAELTS